MSKRSPGNNGDSPAMAEAPELEADVAEMAEPAHPASQTPVVGIGASAGGLEAFTQFLGHLPEKTGLAFVLIQHLDPGHPSELTQLLARATPLPVRQAEQGMAVEPDHIYVIPPNVSLTLERGRLHLAPRPETAAPHLPLDIFFRSLAVDRQGRAIGVILSGTGSDGSLGLAEIKAAGGITFAQDPATAAFGAMPQAAIGTGCVDRVLPPGEFAVELGRLSQHLYLREHGPAAGPLDDAAAFGRILTLLRNASRVDFSDYRDTTLKRRIARRIALHNIQSLGEYVARLEAQPAELDAVYADILINVTSFFRNPEVFEALKQSVFPRIVQHKSLETPIRIWAPGCSTGQETYSLAMALLEYLDGQAVRPTIQIFDTDISDSVAIEKARTGLYPHAIESEVSAPRLRRFFTREEGGYRIAKAIRDMCVFARHNVASDPPFSRLDLVSCRNLLIYLSGNLQKRILPMFHYALLPGGFLLLGAAESVGRFTDLFGEVDKPANIFQRSEAMGRTLMHVMSPEPAGAAPGAGVAVRPPGVAEFLKESDRILLGQYAPPAVLVDQNLEILQFRGVTRLYLEPSTGQASLNLLKMARDSLYLELRDAVAESRQKNAAVRRRQMRFRDEAGLRTVDLEVRPVQLPNSPGRCFLIVFLEEGAPQRPEAPPPARAPGAGDPMAVVAQLNQELIDVREYLQAIIDQQSATNEELQSANEEIRSTNEELQSTNEELQTTKEELQSTNEELRTVNDELTSRSQELTLLSDDLANTLASIRLPIVMLGRDLRLRRFTPAAGKLFNLIPTDIGRPFGDIQPVLDAPDLQSRLLAVIGAMAGQELEVADRVGRWYLLRLCPYQTLDHRIDGVVLVLLDITDRRAALEQMKQAHEQAEAAGQAKDQFLAVFSHELRTPLTPVLAAVSEMREDPALSVEMLSNLEMIHRNVATEAALIDDLLDVTRIARGKLQLNFQTLDLPAVLRRAARDLSAETAAKQLHLALDLDGQEASCIRGDETRLGQVFSNLLRNAIKFTPEGGRITVRRARGSANLSRVVGTDCAPRTADSAPADGPDCPELAAHGSVIVEVSDTGIGIEPARLERLFDAFEQGDVSVTRRFGGLGLGRAIVDLHGGTIAASSPGLGQGATFRVELPTCGRGIELCDRARGAAPVRTLQIAPRAGPLQILLVEDHRDTNRILTRLLQREGHDMHSALGVAAAMELAQRYHFDLVISDLGLPDGSGLDLLRQLRAAGQSARAIALSGYGMEEDVRQCRDAGLDQHLTKPIELDRLRAAIGQVMSR